MIMSFKGKGVEDLYRFENGEQSRLPETLWRSALRKLRYLHDAHDLNDLRSPPGNHLEKLKGTRIGEYSIRINAQWRICFSWEKGDAGDVSIEDYHS